MRSFIKNFGAILLVTILFRICSDVVESIMGEPNILVAMIFYLPISILCLNILVNVLLVDKPKKREEIIEELSYSNDFTKRRMIEMDIHWLRQKAQMMNGLSEGEYTKLKVLEAELKREV